MSRDHLIVPIASTAAPFFQPDSKVIGSIVIFQDYSEQMIVQMDLRGHNQDLELFQLKLISQLQAKTADYDQAIACLQVWDRLLDSVTTAQTEAELLQSLLEQIGKAIAANYCWITSHDPLTNTATICCEYIDRERAIYPTSKLGEQIDLLLYDQFYNHLLTGKSWIDLPTEITPLVYLNLLTPSTLVSIFPLAADSSDDQDLAAQEPNLDIIIGEIGIVTTGKQPWTVGQTSPIAQMLGGAIKLFRQYYRTSDPATESFDFLEGWPDRLDDDSAI